MERRRNEILCVSQYCTNTFSRLCSVYNRRTYEDEDEGEDIREGFDPSEIPATSAPSAEFAIDDDEEEQEEVDLDNSRNKSRARFGQLDDRNVWNES